MTRKMGMGGEVAKDGRADGGRKKALLLKTCNRERIKYESNYNR